ncbi:2-deoxy-D-gluconate 3-dehydrogenase [Propionispira arboris]|uniref:2-deoxy-D-gluconate 3-dehydrogenase n=1 Tax=Propionispira arboris TaxID=84035 RepID=A0A1H6XXT6_9FIRM|nr:SDR family oxidoreductase [Propionispira arboris]SEJ29395.1 2-deoxy-D-gluconate 3-dehydrogenase [Propionispira arboris]
MNEQLSRFSMDYFSLKGKTAIVTGANQGLGMAYAVAFAKAGADLYIPHFTDDIREIKELINAEGKKVSFIQGDLTDPNYRKEVVAGCIREYGKIDVLVNNAGVSKFAHFTEYPDSAWKQCIDIDLNSVYYLSHEIANVMIKQKNGKIINIGSALSFTADKKCPPYTVAKHGVIGMTRVFANELGEYNIQTNAICPGFLATEVNKDLRADPSFYNKITKRIPMERWGELDDLMGTAVFLASKASDYVNGWNISIDGGFTTTL